MRRSPLKRVARTDMRRFVEADAGGSGYKSYQLIRNVLAAYAARVQLLRDARRTQARSARGVVPRDGGCEERGNARAAEGHYMA